MRRHKCGATIQLHGRMAEKRGFDVTISSTTDRASFEGNGVASSFSLPFRFFSNGDIQASLVDAVTGEVTALTLGIDYSLQGAGAPEQAGSPESVITMVVAPAVGKTLFVQRVMEIVQPTDIVNQGRFFPEVHETVFDRLTMLVQQAALGPSRTIRVPEFDPIPGRLPSAGVRANKVFGFDEDGNPAVSGLSMSAIEGQVVAAQEFAQASAASAEAAGDFAAAAESSVGLAGDSASLAEQWAENPEDDPVLPGKFSALHWAAKAAGGAQWGTQPIGMPFPLWTHIPGVSPPPTDNSSYRYIKLTASDAYNTGVLTGESVSGSAPLVIATAVISLAGSPLNGRTIQLINTERRVLRAGQSGVIESDAIQNIVGTASPSTGSGLSPPSDNSTGAFAPGVSKGLFPSFGNAGGFDLTFDASRVARTSTETRAKSIGVTYYMRIK